MYTESKGLAERTVSDKVLKDKADKIALNPEYRHQIGLASIAHKCFDLKNRIKRDSDKENEGKCKLSASSRVTETSN